MSLSTISETLRNLDSDSPVAQALAAVVGTEKSDSAPLLVDVAGQRMWDAFCGLQEGKSVDDVRDLLKSASALLLVASGDHVADYRTMNKAEFETYAAGEISKAAEAGIEGGALDALRTALDVAQILFKGDNESRSFSLPLPLVAKSAPAGEGDAPAADDAPTGETGAAPAADAAAAKAENDAADAAADAVDANAAPEADATPPAETDTAEVGKGDKTDDENETVAKSDDSDAWPLDMAKSVDTDDEPDAPEWGFDSPAAPAAEAATE
jgi:hypothetical protein